MAVVIDAVPGSVTANSYVTLAEANTYHLTNLGSSVWNEDADSDDKAKALIKATRLLDENVNWQGWPASNTQALALPRSGMVNRAGYPYQPWVLPQIVKDAVSEFAQLLLIDFLGGDTGDTDIPAGISSVKAGSVEVKFNSSAAPAQADNPLPKEIWAMISFLADSRVAGSFNIPLIRV
jgi:hypothetical protein